MLKQKYSSFIIYIILAGVHVCAWNRDSAYIWEAEKIRTCFCNCNMTVCYDFFKYQSKNFRKSTNLWVFMFYFIRYNLSHPKTHTMYFYTLSGYWAVDSGLVAQSLIYSNTLASRFTRNYYLISFTCK